jgi:alanine dehydrogenase
MSRRRVASEFLTRSQCTSAAAETIWKKGAHSSTAASEYAFGCLAASCNAAQLERAPEGAETAMTGVCREVPSSNAQVSAQSP